MFNPNKQAIASQLANQDEKVLIVSINSLSKVLLTPRLQLIYVNLFFFKKGKIYVNLVYGKMASSVLTIFWY